MQLVVARVGYTSDHLKSMGCNVTPSDAIFASKPLPISDIYIHFEIQMPYLENYDLMINGRFICTFGKINDVFRAVRANYHQQVGDSLEKQFAKGLKDLKQDKERLILFQRNFKDYPVCFKG